MKNKFKLLVVILLLTVITGCQAKYEVKIYLDGSIKESATLLEKQNEFFETFTRKKFKSYVEKSLEIEGINKKLDDYSIVIDEDLAGIDIDMSYTTIYEYLNTSKAINYLFSKIKLKENEETNTTKIYSIQSEYDVIYNSNDPDEKYFTNTTVTLSLPYKVIETNAHEIDESTNSYTWIIDEDFEGIEIEYSNKLYSYNLLKLANYSTITTISVFVLIVIAIVVIVGILIAGKTILKRDE